MTSTVPPSVRRRMDRVMDLVGRAAEWVPFRDPSGRLHWRMPGANTAIYTVGPYGCSCPATRYGGRGPCKHQQALEIALTVLGAYREHWKTKLNPTP
jgi:predicted nucleic acid-binding Zn finger protein